MKQNPAKQLEHLGQSLWLDEIKRDWILTGKLRKLINEDGIRGVTANPSIFEKAITKSSDYTKEIHQLLRKGKDPQTIYESLAQQDIQQAADLFRPLYDKLTGQDGYVSLEVNPHLAYDSEATIQEARRLWALINRPNIFIKVPATKEGIIAIQQLLSEGININITLLFGLTRYKEVAEAYLNGLEERVKKGLPIYQIASVASFFLSRIDVLIDPQLERFFNQEGEKASLAKKLHGESAIASAKIAYQIYQEIFSSDRFKKLSEKGAHVQRVLWASTGTKNPSYSPVKYIEPLIGPDTVNTLPLKTLESYLAEGHPLARLETDLDKAHWVFRQLPQLGISLDDVAQQLEKNGIELFSQAFDHILSFIKELSSNKENQ